VDAGIDEKGHFEEIASLFLSLLEGITLKISQQARHPSPDAGLAHDGFHPAANLTTEPLCGALWTGWLTDQSRGLRRGIIYLVLRLR
jgi:hypothetical protein